MAQQNSMRVACELTFRQTMYVYYINYIISNFIFFRAQPILSKLKMATKVDNIAILCEDFVNKGLKYLPFWNLVSVI